MDKVELPDGALDAMLKEHALVRAEITERLKTAFSHVAYAGAFVAFAIPAADKIPSVLVRPVSLFAAVIGLGALLWVAALNMRWVQHLGAYLVLVEQRVNRHFGCKVLGWENYADAARAASWLMIPSAPKTLKLAPKDADRTPHV
jgi:hypothetical protein